MSNQSFVVQLNGRDIELAKAVPLKLKDWRKLEEKGITAANMGNGKISDMVTLLFYVLNKADNSVTVDEVEDITLNDPLVLAVVEAINQSERKIDRPSYSSSTSSPTPTAGA